MEYLMNCAKYLTIGILTLTIASCGEEKSADTKKAEVQKIVQSTSSIESVIKIEEYQRLAPLVDDYWFEQKDKFSKQISYLPDFDKDNLDHWRALLEYGYRNTYAGSQLGKSKIIFFVNTSQVEKQINFEKLTDHNRSIVIAMYQILPNGNPLFTVNPFGLIQDDNYFNTLENNRELINRLHSNPMP